MSAHWLIAPVLVPAVAAAILVLLRPLALQRMLSLASCAVLILVAVRLAVDADGGALSVYALGNWRPPFGIVFVLDRVSALMLLLTALLALPVAVAMTGGEDERGPYLHALLQFQLMGLNGAFLTGDLFNLFVFFEVLLIASYCLLLHGQSAGRVRAAWHYVVVNLVGSSLFLIAVALLYAMTGTLNLADLAVRLPALQDGDRVLAHSAALMLLVVFALKAALFPLFLWLAPTYTNASAPVAALFAIMTKVGIYAIVRVYPMVFGATAGEAALDLRLWLLPPALATMACGALAALTSRRLSGIAAQLTLLSVGTVLAVGALSSVAAVSASLYYLAHSTLAGALLFLVCGLVATQRGEMVDLLRRAAPLRHAQSSAVLFLIAAVAVTGIPPMSGFMAKAMLLQASVGESATPWVWSFILVTSFIAILALMRGGIVVFWMSRSRQSAGAGVPVPLLSATLALVTLVLGLAILAGPIKGFTDAAALQVVDTQSYVRAVLSQGGRP